MVCNTLDLIGDYAFANTSRLYASDLKALLLPSSIMEMGEGVFENSGVCRVVFEAGSKLKELPKNAFRESHNLSSVIFNDNSALTTIGEYAFYNCTALSVFSNVNARIETIGAGAFYNCIYLYTLDIQDFTLKNIGAEAFNNMGFVNSFNQNMVTVGNILIKYEGRDSIINIPSSITTIYDGAFSGNTQITAINFATDSKLVAINDNAFNDCINLETINFPRGITSVGNNVVTNTLWYENALRSGLEYITIGNTLIKYNGNAKQVVIPEYVTIINKDAFSGVELYNIEIGAHVTMVKAGALNDIITPQTTYEKGRYHYVECLTPESFSDAKQVSINTYGMENLFYMVGDDYIATPTFILGITDYYIFDSSVKAVQGSWSLTLINPMPFDIEENTINEILVASDDAKEDYLLDMRWDRYAEAIKVIKTFAVTLVFDDEIAQAPELMELEMIYEEIAINVINDDYIFIGWYFDETRRNMVQYPLKLNHNITIYAKFVNYEIGTEGGFSRNDENTEITSYNDDYDKVIVIPAFSDYDITAITGYWAEANPPHTYGTHIFDLDQQIFVPEPDEERATHYYLGAFEARNQVEVVYFANNSKITTIGANAFKDCTSLRKIVLPASITLIEQGAFSGCTSLTEIVFTASLDNKLTIESGAFENCVSLRSITLPNNLAALGHNAFSGCINLIDIHMTDTEATTVIDLSGISPFDTNDGKIKIYVNSAVYNIYSTRWSGYKEFLVEVTDEE